MANGAAVLTRGFVLYYFLGCLLVVGARAQQAETPQPAAVPSVAIETAADLAAKVPAPKADDVKSIDTIVHAAYDVISGPAGPRDWSRFRSLFLPQARFTQVDKGPDGATIVLSWGVDEFIHDATGAFSKEPFYENGIVNQPQSFGNMTQVFSSYESRHSKTEKPFQRGVNSFQLLNDGKRWWILSIFWDSERPDNPLPAKMAKKK